MIGHPQRRDEMERHTEQARNLLQQNMHFAGTRPETRYAMQMATVHALLAIAVALQDISEHLHNRA